ncbi:MAG: hypothetical protein GF317_21755 [Candidatus Lokiarchaeota archaeon]|nr:hypothetical protein [Candidatus Lokiarchaeota archaeon]MBD3202087.1 hypothetical protein [Candidatus Lokiarchaeota archaeon]
MFSLEEFSEYPELESSIKKINKYYTKGKDSKLKSIIENLTNQLDNERLAIPITFILSIIVEEKPKIVEESIFKKVRGLLNSENNKIKINSVLILGFYILSNLNLLSQEHISDFMGLIDDESEDVKDNVYFFLNKIRKENPNIICSFRDTFINHLDKELKSHNKKNVISLLIFLSECKRYKFNKIYLIRKSLVKIIESFRITEDSKLLHSIFKVLKQLFPEFSNIDVDGLSKNQLLERLKDTFIARKYNFNRISKKTGISFQEFLDNFKKSSLKDEEIYFYTKNRKTKQTSFYEIEKQKTIDFFNKTDKISHKAIVDKFIGVLGESELELFIKTLTKLGFIRGFLSDFYFYPFNYIKKEIAERFENEGKLILKDFNYLPLDLVKTLIVEYQEESSNEILIGKNEKIYYLLTDIKDLVTKKAAKEPSIDLKEYRDILKDNSYLKLVKNLPKKYLTKYHKGVTWLTNIGKFRVEKEIKNSKIIGYFNFEKVSEKLGLNKLLLFDLFNTNIDVRSGLWDSDQNIFYYSKFIKDRIDKINKITETEEKKMRIEELSKELKIRQKVLLTKISENVESIGEEIKSKDQIKITEYIEKTGMNEEKFFNYLNKLGMNYLRKGDTLIFNPRKIENAKKELKSFILQQSNSNDYLELGNVDINSKLMQSLIEELQEEGNIQGIFYEEGNDINYYTERGIKNMMLENKSLFSLHDLFYGKELEHDEIQILKNIFNELYDSNQLNGKFEEDTLTFMSDDVLFAKDYNAELNELEKAVNEYFEIFNTEFQMIKSILTKESTIFPQEIKAIQDAIDRINDKYIYWRSKLDAFINRINKKVLNNQGYSLKQYKKVSVLSDEKESIKSFKEDPEVQELMDGFNLWVKLFNKIELKYQNVIFYQKRLIKNPNDTQTRKKLIELQEELNLI